MQPAQRCGAASPGALPQGVYGTGQPLATTLARLGIPGAHDKPWPGSAGCTCSCGQLGAGVGRELPPSCCPRAAQPCKEMVQSRGAIFPRYGGCNFLPNHRSVVDVQHPAPPLPAWLSPSTGCRGCPRVGAPGRAVLGAGRGPAVTLSRGACRREPVLPGHRGHDLPVPALVQPHAGLLQGVLGLLYPLPAAGEHRAPAWGWRLRGEELLSLHLSLPSERGSSCRGFGAGLPWSRCPPRPLCGCWREFGAAWGVPAAPSPAKTPGARWCHGITSLLPALPFSSRSSTPSWTCTVCPCATAPTSTPPGARAWASA